jgi:hypothetical protein
LEITHQLRDQDDGLDSLNKTVAPSELKMPQTVALDSCAHEGKQTGPITIEFPKD